jgi:hypothetical protein
MAWRDGNSGQMRYRVRNLPLAVIAGIFLLFQALAIGLGPGARVCLDPVCGGVVVAATAEDCCGGDCVDGTPEPQIDPPCACQWLPIVDEPLAELAITASSFPAPIVAAPPMLLLDPVVPIRHGARPAGRRPPPHLNALRSIVLTC